MSQRRSYTRHGLNAVMTRVKIRGLKAIDRRSMAAREALAWRRELLADLGGEAEVSAAQLALVEIAVRTRLFIDHCDAALLERSSLLVRGRRLLPLVEQRQRLADSLARLLGQLGLERRAKPVPSLRDFLQPPDPTPVVLVEDRPGLAPESARARVGDDPEVDDTEEISTDEILEERPQPEILEPEASA